MREMSRSLTYEILLVARFSLIGGLSTAIHITILWLLLSKSPLHPLAANIAAYSCAFGVSFFGNYLWTFGASGSIRRAALRFLIISASALSINLTILSAILSLDWLDPISAAIGAALTIPALTYLASRLWGFEHRNRTPKDKKAKHQ